MLNSNTKITIEKGCADYLVGEVEELRQANKILTAENNVAKNFFTLVNRLGDRPSEGFAQDRFYQARSEIEKSIAVAEHEYDQKNTKGPGKD